MYFEPPTTHSRKVARLMLRLNIKFESSMCVLFFTLLYCIHCYPWNFLDVLSFLFGNFWSCFANMLEQLYILKVDTKRMDLQIFTDTYKTAY
jgi:hypothetical protein